MCNSCGVSGCSCNKKRHCSAVDQVLVPGPQGIAGQNGLDGGVGPQGPAGASGGLQFEQYINLDTDFSWSQVETVIPGATHNVSADGNYQIQVDTSSFVNGGLDFNSEMRLYVNGVPVVNMRITSPSESIPDVNSVQKNIGMNYRAPGLLTGETIELRTVLGSPVVAVTTKVNILINKES